MVFCHLSPFLWSLLPSSQAISLSFSSPIPLIAPTGQSGFPQLPGLLGEESKGAFLGSFAPPTPSGRQPGRLGRLSAAFSVSQPADNGGLTPSGCPAVIQTELQQLAQPCPAQLGLAPDLGYSCLGRAGWEPAQLVSPPQRQLCASVLLSSDSGYRGRDGNSPCGGPK